MILSIFSKEQKKLWSFSVSIIIEQNYFGLKNEHTSWVLYQTKEGCAFLAEYVGREPRWVTAAPPSPRAQREGRVSVALPSLTTSTTAQEGQAAPHLSTTSASDKNNSVANITGQLGGSAFLPCTTHHSMERQVGHKGKKWINVRQDNQGDTGG